MSFILDALRKSEHERQRSAVPGLSQVPLAAPPPQLPRWALGVMAVLAAALLVLGGAWWQSTRAPEQVAEAPPSTVERSVQLPSPSLTRPAPQAAPSRSLAQEAAAVRDGSSLADAAAPTSERDDTFVSAAGPSREINLPDDAAALRAPSPESLNLPSAAALAARGVAVPPLHLELHAYSERARDRFVFINGRKYVEGEQLAEGPQVVAIEPTGAVLSHAGQRFLLVQE